MSRVSMMIQKIGWGRAKIRKQLSIADPFVNTGNPSTSRHSPRM